MSLLEILPEINRARGYYLYTSDRKRLLDMYLEEGRLIMGHRQQGYSLALKNALERGIFTPFPSKYTVRLKKALKSVFGSDMHIYLFRDSFSAEAALRLEDREYSVLRPLETGEPGDTFVFLLPVPEAFAPGVIVSRVPLDAEEDCISPVIAAGAERGMHNYRAFLEKTPDLSLGKELTEALSQAWDIKGFYMYSKLGAAEYGQLFEKALDGGIVISPYSGVPTVIPPVLSENDRKKLLLLAGI